MFTRKRFQLARSTLAIQLDDWGGHKWLSLPIGATPHVVSGPTLGEDGRMLHVRWEDLVMFAIDQIRDGTELRDEMTASQVART